MIPDLGTILGVWAHPDDEGYLSAGIMADAVRNGRRVVCVTATRGEAADPDRWPPAELAQIRTMELANCMAILGVTEHRWLDYADGGCAEVGLDDGAARIAAIIDEVRPDSVLTFGPDGQTGHPDHVAVCDWTTRALAQSDHHAVLYYATNSAEWADTFEQAARDMGVMMGAESMPRHAREHLAIHALLDGELLDLKERAMRAQATQVDDMRNAMGHDLYRKILREESFRRP